MAFYYRGGGQGGVRGPRGEGREDQLLSTEYKVEGSLKN